MRAQLLLMLILCSFSPKPHVVIVANGASPSKKLLESVVTNQTTLVAVDGGLDACHLTPDLITGDFDSATTLASFSDVPKLYIENQDKTDLEKALDYLFTFPIEKVTILGALGKRLDHELTNILLLTRYPKVITLVTERETCFALPKEGAFSCDIGQTLSLIPINGEVTKIQTDGLRWELDGGTLSKEFIGISNIADKEQITISYGEGDLICCLNNSTFQ